MHIQRSSDYRKCAEEGVNTSVARIGVHNTDVQEPEVVWQHELHNDNILPKEV